MDEKPPFDPDRAAFLLILIVVCVYSAVILASVAGCLFHVTDIITNPDISCDPNNRLMGLLAAALAAALTYARIRK